MSVLYQAYFGILAHEEGQKFHGQVHNTREVGIDLGVESGRVEFRRLCKVGWGLESCVQKDAVQVWVGVCDAKVGHGQNIW